MFGWLTFYHQGHEVAKDFKPYMTELQLKIQKVGNFAFILMNYFLTALSIVEKKILNIFILLEYIHFKLLCFLRKKF